MSFGLKSSKRNIKFNVDFHLEELSSVPYVTGFLFAKCRLLQGGNFIDYTRREEVNDHSVEWNTHFHYECKITVSNSTGMLDTCLFRVSVRRETQGGKSFEKLGFADINLAEYGDGIRQSRGYLLNEYKSSSKPYNSLVQATISMKLREGDFCFRVPPSSLPSYVMPPLGNVAFDTETDMETCSVSELSRQNSSLDSVSGVVRNDSFEFGSYEETSGRFSALDRIGSRVGLARLHLESTRVDAESVIDELLKECGLGDDDDIDDDEKCGTLKFENVKSCK